MKTIRHLCLLSLAVATTLSAEPIPENLRQNGWFIGAQAYTFKEFTTFEAIAKTKEAGGNMIEIYPGQKMKPGSDVKIHHTMPEEAIVELLAQRIVSGDVPETLQGKRLLTLDVGALVAGTKIIARVDGIHTVTMGQDVRLAVKTHLAHFFDPASGAPLR
jgi:hypothetical protein